MKKRLLSVLMILALSVCLGACKDAGNEQTEEEFKLSFDTVDTILPTIGQYSGLTADVEKVEITDDMVEEYANEFFTYEASSIENWVARNKDTVVIDFVGKIDGVAFEGGTATNQELVLGSGNYIAGFEEGLLGVVEGDKRELELTFPETYGNAELAGKPCTFDVTVIAVIPGLYDESITALGNEMYKDAADYKVMVSQLLEVYLQDNQRTEVVTKVLSELIETSDFGEFPEEYIELQRNNVLKAFEEDAAYYGLDVKTYLEYCGSSVEAVADDYARQQAVFVKIAKEQGIDVSEAEIDEFVDEMVLYYDSVSSAEEIYQQQSREEIYMSLLCEKVSDYLVSVTNINDVVAQ